MHALIFLFDYKTIPANTDMKHERMHHVTVFLNLHINTLKEITEVVTQSTK